MMSALLGLFFCVHMLIITAYEAYDYDVIIMGAGMTGISAGDVLHKAGLKILIIEAQDYVGGRTKVARLGNYSFNVGASWIEGYCAQINSDPKACIYQGHAPIKENPMQTLARKYNLTTTDQAFYWDYSMLGFIPEGSNESVHFVNQTEVETAELRWNNTQECMAKLMREMDNDWEWQDISYSTALFKCGWSPPLTPVEKVFQYTGFTFEYAELAKYTSFLGTEQNTFEDFGKYSAFFTDPQGYAGITLGVAGEYLNLKNISAEPKLIINSPITKIEHNYGHKVTVTVEPTDGTPTRTYNAKFGIATFSLGVMQSDIIEWVPPLPDLKRDAFLAESMVDYLPVLVQWPYNFWDKLGITSHCITFADPRDNYWLWAYNFDHKDFYPGSHVWRFDLAVTNAHRIQYQSGKDTLYELMHQKLSHFFGATVLPEPVAILHHDWRRNKYVQGMYSNWNVGMNSEKWGEMIEPYVEEGLYFAGEAVAVYSGLVQGAYENGIETAKAVIAANV